MTGTDTSSAEIVRRLGLVPHPEGGFYREVFRSPLEITQEGRPTGASRRPAKTSIYYLLEAEDFSAWHRVRTADETWHLYAGGSLELHTIDCNGSYALHVLSANLALGQPQCTIPAGCWQAARPAPGAAWVLCGCTVAPGFEFADFDMPPLPELLVLFPRHAAIWRALAKR
jgi:uncharacterized protein